MTEALEHAVRARGATMGHALGCSLPARFGAPEAEWRAAREHCAVFVAGFRTFIAATGEDRVTFLHGMLSNDVKALRPGRGTYATLLNQNGKIVADLRAHADADRLLLCVQTARADAVVEALGRFLIADEVELTRLTDEAPLLALEGPAARRILSSVVGSELPVWESLEHHVMTFAGRPLRVIAVSEFDGRGYLLCGAPQLAAPLFEAVCAAGAAPAGMEALNVLRVEAGVPWYGLDMDESVLVMELGLERGISFTKGCYLGQEVVERIAARGHVNRKLCGLLVEGSELPAPGSELIAGERAAGHITSAVRSMALQRIAALGYVHRNFLEPGTPLGVRIGEQTTGAAVAALPFVRSET